jgi:hypothetical protein
VAAQSGRAGGDLTAFHRRRAASAASLTGLAVAWGGMALLVSPAARLLGPSDRLSTQILGQLAFWAIFAIVIAIVLYWEEHPIPNP